MEDHVFQVGNTEIHPQMVDVTTVDVLFLYVSLLQHAMPAKRE